MKLRRLAGYGPIAAFVSAGSLLVFLFLQEAGSAIVAAAPSMFVPLAVTFVFAQWLWVAGLAVVVFDLEWLEHPSTSTAWFRVAQVAILVALVMPIPIGIAPFTVGVNLQAPAFLLLFLGVATTLLVHNFEGRRVGLLRGPLPWLGIATGVLYAISGLAFIGILLPSIGMTVFMFGLNINMLTEIAYIVWAVWMGVHLTRSRTATSAVARPATV